MTDPRMSDEMAADFQTIIAGLTVSEFKEMILRTIKSADAASMSLVKEVRQNEDGSFGQVYTILFNRPSDSEFK